MQLLLAVLVPLSAGTVIPTMIFPRPAPLPCESQVNTAIIHTEITTTMDDWIEDLSRNPMSMPRMSTDNNDLRIYMQCIHDRVHLPTNAFRRLIELLQRDDWFQSTGVPMA
jgi:hypothetical protein